MRGHRRPPRAQVHAVQSGERAPDPGRSSLRHHHLDELLVVDLAVAINIGLTDHLVDLLVRQLLT